MLCAFKILISVFSVSASLLIAGGGKLEANLKDLSEELHLTDKVIFLGSVKYDEVIKYYKLADLFVRPSLSEGQGVSFIEAMAAGLPIIATPVGGIPDFLLDRKTGLFCQRKNPKDLAEKINLLLEDKKLYQEIQTNSLELVRQKYDWNLIAQRMEKIFNNLTK